MIDLKFGTLNFTNVFIVLQIWDFSTGQALEMADLEVCSALAMMSDNDKVVFGRSDKFGGGTNIVVWDLLGNQPIKHMRFDAPIGNNDYVHFLALSQVRSHACNNHSMILKSSFWHSSPVCPTLLLYSLSLPPPSPVLAYSFCLPHFPFLFCFFYPEHISCMHLPKHAKLRYLNVWICTKCHFDL